MKREIFSLLMNIKNEVLKAVYGPDKITKLVDSEMGAVVVNDPPGIPEDKQSLPDSKLSTVLRGGDEIIHLLPETRYFEVTDAGMGRKVAYTISGNLNAKKVLLCLPGLLETKASFMLLHSYFLKFEECLVISIDLSGRGESDSMGDREAYKMSLYLADISQLIREVIFREKVGRAPKLTVLGTSMGGVLAMHLTKIFDGKIAGIILNDIALTVNWTSLYSLYKSMKNEAGFKEVRELAKDLSVDERAIRDVQLPGHFDLSFRADIWGMNFHEALEGYSGKVGLVYGGKSQICTKQRVEEAREFFPKLKLYEVPDSGHPAPFNIGVCGFIQSEMNI